MWHVPLCGASCLVKGKQLGWTASTAILSALQDKIIQFLFYVMSVTPCTMQYVFCWISILNCTLQHHL